jgi:hypothetical protein
MRKLIVAVAVLGVLASAATVLAAGRGTVKVTSTLDGHKVLPRRIPWTVTTSPRPPKQSWVSFLIDGKSLDVDYVRKAAAGPGGSNTFAGDGGYLVTTWLKPGAHTFTARVHPAGGTAIDDTVVAKVPSPAPVPAALAGTWERAVADVSGAPKEGSSGNPTNTAVATGTYRLTFDPRWIEAVFPGSFNPGTSFKTGRGLVFYNDWTPGAKTFDALGYVRWHNPKRNSPDAGSWCNAGGPTAGYGWSVSGDTLTLTPAGGTDACGIRGFIWAGTWTRVH